MEKLKINEIIVVEGKYDKIKLASFIDGVIIETGGFRIFKDKEKLEYIKKAAGLRGIIILTDGDAAGFQIRAYLKRELQGAVIKNAYIPDVLGKEKRKTVLSAEGKLGVEGQGRETILKALKNAGVSETKRCFGAITKQRFYELGLVGGENSSEARRELARKLDLPARMSANALLEAVNLVFTEEEFEMLFITRETET